MFYWFSGEFAQDNTDLVWVVDWAAWQTAYDNANALGKAILLKNASFLAIRDNDFAVASAMHQAALGGTDRELKAVALAYGHPSLGTGVTSTWETMAADNSDPELQSLAQQALANQGL